MPPPKIEFPGFEKSGGENASHMDLGGGGEHVYIYIYICVFSLGGGGVWKFISEPPVPRNCRMALAASAMGRAPSTSFRLKKSLNLAGFRA